MICNRNQCVLLSVKNFVFSIIKRIYNYHVIKNKITSVLDVSLKGCRKDLTPHSHKQDKRNKKLKYDYQNERYVTRFSLLDT